MKYMDRLLQDTEYLEIVKKLEQAEAARIFCRHGLSHFLDVARIAWIMVLEQEMSRENPGEPGNLEILKEKIYLTALLHDLGRLEELEQGTPHHEAGVWLAEKFLNRIDYPKEGQQDILSAILGHRGEGQQDILSDTLEHREEGKEDILSGVLEYQGEEKLNYDLIYIIKKADNRSRNCFFCEAQRECKWRQERRNKTVLR